MNRMNVLLLTSPPAHQNPLLNRSSFPFAGLSLDRRLNQPDPTTTTTFCSHILSHPFLLFLQQQLRTTTTSLTTQPVLTINTRFE